MSTHNIGGGHGRKEKVQEKFLLMVTEFLANVRLQNNQMIFT
jgi:hypothetical protein